MHNLKEEKYMKKLKYKVLLLIVTLFIITFPNFSNAAKVSVDKVSKVWVKYTTASKIKVKWKKVNNATGYRVYVYNQNQQNPTRLSTMRTTLGLFDLWAFI